MALFISSFNTSFFTARILCIYSNCVNFTVYSIRVITDNFYGGLLAQYELYFSLHVLITLTTLIACLCTNSTFYYETVKKITKFVIQFCFVSGPHWAFVVGLACISCATG